MTILKPIRGIRPKPEYVRQIVSGEYDYEDEDDARQRAPDRPDSFIHVLWPVIDLPPDTNPHDEKVYAKGRENYERLQQEGRLLQDEQPCLYVYRQTVNGRQRTGIIGGAAIDDYFNDTIKKHEQTRAAKEKDRIRHIEATQIHAGPIMLFYESVEAVDQIVATVIQQTPLYDFETGHHPDAQDGKIRHTLWRIGAKDHLRKLGALFDEQVSAAYIADGHHRSAAAAKVGRKRRQQETGTTGEEPYNYFLAMFFPEQALDIYPFNRVVKDLNGLEKGDFLAQLSKKFEVSKRGQQPYEPAEKHNFGMYLDGEWYALRPKKSFWKADDPIDELDVSILQKNILEPVLGIQDPRRDKRLGFWSGIGGVESLVESVDSGEMRVGFVLYPVTIQQLMKVADHGETMPPKSTWVEPKLLSGLVVHSIEQEA